MENTGLLILRQALPPILPLARFSLLPFPLFAPATQANVYQNEATKIVVNRNGANDYFGLRNSEEIGKLERPYRWLDAYRPVGKNNSVKQNCARF